MNATFVWAVCALLAAQAPADRPRIAPDDAALARIKAGLQKPAPRLIVSAPKADFRVNIEAIRPFADLFELPPWVTPPRDFDAPRTGGDPHSGVIVGVGIDPGVVAHSISNAVRTRNAHAEVIRAVIEYCASHRDEPGAAGICGGPPR